MEKKMKNILMIIILSLILFSCGEKEEAEDDTASVIEASSTASGSITVGSETLSGTYATSCITAGVSDMASSGSVPSDTKALAWIFVVRGNDNITEEQHGFTDTTCTTKNYHSNLVYDNVSVGSASGSNYQVLQLYTGVNLLANTTAADTWLETQFSVTLTVETEKNIQLVRTNLMVCGIYPVQLFKKVLHLLPVTLLIYGVSLILSNNFF